MKEILDFLPHRPPMLMVDKVLEFREDGCTAIKNISYSEPCFQGHFPGNPIFPGVLIIEALAQTCSVWLNRDGNGKTPIFAGIESARFRSRVQPGDRMKMEIRFVGERKGFYTFSTIAAVDERVACEATLTVCCKDF